jgi:hypothetical protein
MNRRHLTAVSLLASALLWLLSAAAFAQDTRNCADFSTQEEAQAFYDDHKDDDPSDPDPNDLDTDGDGQACEGLPTSGATTSPSPSKTSAPSTTSGARTVSGASLTAGSPTVTAPGANFTSSDVGRSISGTGIPSGTSILSVQSATSATMDADATQTATGVTITIGSAASSDDLPASGAATAVMALSGLTLLEAGYGLTLASKRLGVRRRSVPLHLMRKLVAAAGRGEAHVKVSEDVYLVHRSVLESADARLVPVPEPIDEPVADTVAPMYYETPDVADMPAILDGDEFAVTAEEPADEAPRSEPVVRPPVYAALARPDSLSPDA